MTKFTKFILVCLCVISYACAQETGEKDAVVTISTKYGDMVAILYDETPQHKENFLKLAREGYFNGTLFHRVIKDFMIQGGDPDSKHVKPGDRLGNGGPGYNVPAEINPKFYHVKGALSAARLGDQQNPKKESSGSQFFIVQGKIIPQYEVPGLKINTARCREGLSIFARDPKNRAVMDSLNQLQMNNQIEELQEKIFSLVPRLEKETGLKIMDDNPKKIKDYTTVGGYPPLDGEYTVFGQVIKGLDVIDKIAVVQGDEVDRPVVDVPMTVTVKEMSRKKITEEYGYQYPASK